MPPVSKEIAKASLYGWRNDRTVDVEELFRKYRDPVFNFLLRMAGRYDVAVDLTQDVFVSALRGAHSLRDPDRAKAWLFRIAKNTGLRNLEKEHRRREEPLDESNETSSVGWRQAEDMHVHRERADAVQRALNSLPPKMRLVVLLKDMQGMSYGEIEVRVDQTRILNPSDVPCRHATNFRSMV